MENQIQIPTTLTHITDVGAPNGDGCDSTERIVRQYQRLCVANPRVVSAGQSPFHVAFAACTDVSKKARQAADIVTGRLGAYSKQYPVALNSAPRNDKSPHERSEAGYIYRMRGARLDAGFLAYGEEVVSWILAFRGRLNDYIYIDEIQGLNLDGYIIDTRNGSQFRSAEHLPIVHVLDAIDELKKFNAEIKRVSLDDFPDLSLSDNGDHLGEFITAPPDEYGNGRIIVTKHVADHIKYRGVASIPSISDKPLKFRQSLTEVVPGELAIWPSSNYLPVPGSEPDELVVLNVGTRWSPGKTRIVDDEVLESLRKLSSAVGEKLELGL